MASSRITGKFGSLFLHVNASPALASVVKVADTYDVRFESDVDMAECTRKGEGFRRYMPGSGGAKLSCKANFQALAALVVLTDDTLATAAMGSLVRCAFKLVTLSTLAAGATLAAAAAGVAGQQIIQGFGWINRASLSAPFNEKIDEDLEITVDGEWAFVTST